MNSHINVELKTSVSEICSVTITRDDVVNEHISHIFITTLSDEGLFLPICCLLQQQQQGRVKLCCLESEHQFIKALQHTDIMLIPRRRREEHEKKKTK
jgi:hypothetical protein